MRCSAPIIVLALLLCPTTSFVQQSPFQTVVPGQSRSLSTECKSSFADADEKNEEEQQDGNSSNRRLAPNNRASLRWVRQSIERNENNESPPPNPELLKALEDLEDARTQKRAMEVGQVLSSLNIENETLFVQERLIKATSISGLLPLSSSLLDGLLEKGLVPSDIAYTALCKSLRQARKLTQLEDLLHRLGAASKGTTPISTVAFNTYLAALCDTVTKQDLNRRRNLRMEDIGQLEKARKYLKPGKAKKSFRVTPDESSYATVLHAAASVGNRGMVNDLWNEMRQQDIIPNRYAYNALMKAICVAGPDYDDEAINLLEQMRRNPFLQPDRYTIDLALLPIVRVQGIERVKHLLREFALSYRSQPKVQSQAFSSFLNTLVQADEIETAQEVFEIFLLPEVAKALDAGQVVRFPNIRHFNILLNGLKNSMSRKKSPAEKEEVRNDSANLYRIMLKAGIRPDEYTLTILVGMADSSDEIVKLLRTAVDEGVEVTPVVLRSMLVACGELNDPGSACWLFDSFRQDFSDAKTWNALIGALADSATTDSYLQVASEKSVAAGALGKDFAIVDKKVEQSRPIASILDGRTCSQAALLVLNIMNRNVEMPFKTPRPNTQTYCLVASAMQHGDLDSTAAEELFWNATNANIPADGRFVNAIFRCFGPDIGGALTAWKGGIRQACLAAEKKASSNSQRSTSRNLLAAYQGLLYVCGRALRPDIALRLVYAMNKEGVQVNEMALQCFLSGKRRELADAENNPSSRSNSVAFGEQFETLLSVECTKYDSKDKRRENDKRVRIIL